MTSSDQQVVSYRCCLICATVHSARDRPAHECGWSSRCLLSAIAASYCMKKWLSAPASKYTHADGQAKSTCSEGGPASPHVCACWCLVQTYAHEVLLWRIQQATWYSWHMFLRGFCCASLTCLDCFAQWSMVQYISYDYSFWSENIMWVVSRCLLNKQEKN